ncbi:MAG: hypothetical protein P1P76_04200 [Anaerolineales bacterium]|nr:hypothetical protein [Anaerolineales bacterium]
MNKLTARIASILAFIIGAMAIFAGGQVLLGKLPDYYVIDWLPIYNFSMGVISAFISAVLIWKRHRLARTAALVTLGAHAFVMVILQTAYADVVAPDSLQAMTLRITVWVVIGVLTLIPDKETNTLAAGNGSGE